MSKRQSQKPVFDLTEKIQAVDHEFRHFLAELAFKKEHDLQTYSPLDAVQDFQIRNMPDRVAEVSRIEMMDNEIGMRKLFANMLAQCKPGALSQDDVDQLSGINGRELQLD